MRVRVFLVVCGLLLSAAGEAAATGGFDLTPLGVDRRISTATAHEVTPQVAWNQTDNQYLVVWDDRRSLATRGREIYGRRVGADGVLIGSDFRISTSTSDETNPQVEWNASDNQYLVVWEDYRDTGTRGREIYGRRVGADGAAIAADFRISTSTSSEMYPQVVWNETDNEYLVVWQDYRACSTRGYEIYGRRVGADGVRGTADFRISKSTSSDLNPAVAWNGSDNQYLVVWTDWRNSATRGTEIFGRVLGADGVAIAADFRISTSTSNELYPQAVWNATDNQYLVVWQDHRSTATRGTEIFGRRLGAGGVLIGTDVRISTSTADEYDPQVVWNATANQYLAVWHDTRSQTTRGVEIYGRRVGGDGVPLGHNVRISNSTSSEYGPQVAWNETANQYLVVWDDNRSQGTRGMEIYGRRLTGDPAP